LTFHAFYKTLITNGIFERQMIPKRIEKIKQKYNGKKTTLVLNEVLLINNIASKIFFRQLN